MGRHHGSRPSDLCVGKTLGKGRNGAVFLASWKGKDVALKQFDLSKSEKAYYKELDAYLAVKEAWGRLVPRLYFVSESWSGGVVFIGMQLGKNLDTEDCVSRVEEWRQVLLSLEEEFDLRHNDIDGNHILIPDERNLGDECLVAID